MSTAAYRTRTCALLLAIAAPTIAPAQVPGQPARPARAATVQVLDAVAPAPPPGAPTVAVYLRLRNGARSADALVSASTPLATQAMLHEQSLEGGVMRMRMLARLELPAGGELRMHPGGTHLMLGGLRHAPLAGERFALQLRFAQSAPVTVQVRVLPLGAAP